MNEKIMYEYETEPVIQNNYKPLKKALWFTPVAFLVPTIITNTLALISDIILGVVVGIFGYYDNLALINVVLKIINVLGTSVLLIIVVLLLKMLKFRVYISRTYLSQVNFNTLIYSCQANDSIVYKFSSI